MATDNEALATSASSGEKTVTEVYDSKHGAFKCDDLPEPSGSNPATKLDPKPFTLGGGDKP